MKAMDSSVNLVKCKVAFFARVHQIFPFSGFEQAV